MRGTPATRRRDLRLPGLLLTLGLVLGGGWWLERAATAPPMAAGAADPLRDSFAQAVSFLQGGRHAEAVTALHRVLALAPRLPEAHVNMGFALLGLGRAQAARDFFDSATALAPGQANAYYGLAMAWEASGDLAMATGAMRSYLHLAREERPEHLARARAALWTWEQARRAAPPGDAGRPAAAPAGRELASTADMTPARASHRSGHLPDSGNRFPPAGMSGGRP